MRGDAAPTGGGGRDVTATPVGEPGGVIGSVDEGVGKAGVFVASTVTVIAGVMVGKSISAGENGVTATVGCNVEFSAFLVGETASLVAERDGVIFNAGDTKVAQS